MSLFRAHSPSNAALLMLHSALDPLPFSTPLCDSLSYQNKFIRTNIAPIIPLSFLATAVSLQSGVFKNLDSFPNKEKLSRIPNSPKY